MPQFKLDQIALCPVDRERAIALLTDMGLTDWAFDEVHAIGKVHGKLCENVGYLSFNYQAFAERRELEVLHYQDGPNWMEGREGRVSHLGMHCSPGELEEWKAFFAERGISIAQEVRTVSHDNPAIAGKRWYHYCIFDTTAILGVDVKFIVRFEHPREVA